MFTPSFNASFLSKSSIDARMLKQSRYTPYAQLLEYSIKFRCPRYVGSIIPLSIILSFLYTVIQ